MTLNIDLLGLAGAEYTEINGVKGVFIPEVPNFIYTPGSGLRKGATPARAMAKIGLYKTMKQTQNYDWMGRQLIPSEYQDAYLANPNMVSRKRYCAYGYNYSKGKDGAPGSVSSKSEFERLLDD